MAVTLNRGRSEQLHLQKFNNNEDGGEQVNDHQTHKRTVVPVVYYLARNGQLEHPHFMEVPLSSSNGLFLSDVILRLNLLRGTSMASRYSWSSKRSYKNGYVWHDLSEDDFIHPVHGGEYVLKGSELLAVEPNSASTVSKISGTCSSSSSSAKKSGESEIPPRKNLSYYDKNRRRNQSWGAIDLHEYKVYKSESTHEFAGNVGADASTQTDEKRRRISSNKKSVVIKEEPEQLDAEIGRNNNVNDGTTTELSREEISPPPSDSSPETLETLMKADGRLSLPTTLSSSSSSSIIQGGGDQTVGGYPSGRMKASSVLMSLISCGSISFRDCGVAAVKDHGLSMISQSKNSKMTRGGNQTVEEGSSNNNDGMMMREIENSVSSSFAKMALEDKEYFSGSLIESTAYNKQQVTTSILKRSSSYNADRNLQLKLEEKEVEGVRAKCIPRRPRTQTSISKKDSDTETTRHLCKEALLIKSIILYLLPNDIVARNVFSMLQDVPGGESKPQKYPYASAYQNKCTLFASDRATGDGAEQHEESTNAMETEIDRDSTSEPSSGVSSKKLKRDRLADAVNFLAESFKEFVSKLQVALKPSSREIYDVVSSILGLSRQQVLKAVKRFIRGLTKEFEMLKDLTKEEKLDWILLCIND